MEIKKYLISSVFCFGIVFASQKAATFTSETVAQRLDIIKYKKIERSLLFNLFGQNSKTQCSEVCVNEFSCKSFHVDDGACVFGVAFGVTSFDEDGEEATPDGEQRIQAKSMQ